MDTKKLATPRPRSAAVFPESPSAANPIEFRLRASTRLNTTSRITLLFIKILLFSMNKKACPDTDALYIQDSAAIQEKGKSRSFSAHCEHRLIGNSKCIPSSEALEATRHLLLDHSA